MEDPIKDISKVVRRLTQRSPHDQQAAIDRYFAYNASFTHPFCRTGSFDGSRGLIASIFKWYKIMSPTIELTINSVAYDEQNLILYVNISQVFAIWFIPFHRAPVTLTTQLQLVKTPNGKKYLIQSQNDLYQFDQFVKFVLPWGIGATIVILVNFWATFLCVVAAFVGKPLTKYHQKRWDIYQQKKADENGRAEAS